MKTELKEKIKNSGNNLHLSVVDILENEGWKVDISPYYCDDLTDRPREIDIIATNRRSILFPNSKDKNDFYNVVLCIECKCFTDEVCFRVFDNKKDIGKRVLLNQKYNLNIDEALKRYGMLFDGHHYLNRPKIAKLYEYSKIKQGGKSQEDDVFQAITQSIKSTIFFMKSGNNDALGNIYYPMIVYNKIDGIYFMEENRIDDAYLDGLAKQKNVIFHLKYSYPETIFNVPGVRYRSNDFYVDFVHKDELKNFVTDIIIKKECDSIWRPVLHD